MQYEKSRLTISLSLQSIREQMQSELLTIVTKSTHHIMTLTQQQNQNPYQYQQVASPPPNNSEDLPEQNIPILELLELVFKQLKLIANAHQLTLKNYHNVMHRYNLTQVKAYDLIEYWGQAQAVLKLVLTDYLDIQNDSSDELMRAQFTEQTTNINTFFSRRKVQGKKMLFKFDKSSHTASLEAEVNAKEHRRNPSNVSNSIANKDDVLNQSGLNGQNLLNTSFNKHLTVAPGADRKKRERALVCTPDAGLVRQIYLPMMGYIHEIEGFMKCKSG